MLILVTGGLGFIGSHTCIELLNENHSIVVVDNLSNCKIEVCKTIEKIANKKIELFIFDINDKQALEHLFTIYKFDLVIHFAGLKSVTESIEKPLMYYINNVCGTLTLLKVMDKFKCKNLIFSSSATVYGNVNHSPLTEDMITGLGITNPYGKNKYMLEEILKDISLNSGWKIVILRYFNPIGSHPLLKENPKNIPNNLFPYILKVVNKELDELNIFGNDYPTKDGTCIRDFIHVIDLAKAHVKSIDCFSKDKNLYIYNVGTGIGHSVLDVVTQIEDVKNIKIPYTFKERREGDIDVLFANVDKIKDEIGWEVNLGLREMCEIV